MALIMWLAIISALLLAALVTITFRTTVGKLIAYVACAISAVAPLFEQYVVMAYAVAGLVMAAAVVIGRRVWARREGE
jgi:hypothetical protein